jgi:hypothetical protein
MAFARLKRTHQPRPARHSLLLGWVVMAALMCAPGTGRAQASQAGAAPATSDNLLNDNALIRSAEQYAPKQVPNIRAALLQLQDGRQSSLGMGKGVPHSIPTPEEKVQLAQNPAFAAAYAHHPTDTLSLLDWVMKLDGL